jgi:hypothetical protein
MRTRVVTATGRKRGIFGLSPPESGAVLHGCYVSRAHRAQFRYDLCLAACPATAIDGMSRTERAEMSITVS